LFSGIGVTGVGSGVGSGLGTGAGVTSGAGTGVISGFGTGRGAGVGVGTGLVVASGTGTSGATVGFGCVGSDDDSSFLLSQAATKATSPKRAKIFDMFFS
jgi:hypothetical protein